MNGATPVEKLVLGTIPVSTVKALVDQCVEAMLDVGGVNALDRLQINRPMMRAQVMPMVIAQLAIIQAMNTHVEEVTVQ